MIKAGVLAALYLGVSAGFAMADGDVVEGKKVFQRCASCHSITEKIDKSKAGPHLMGIVGRPVAAARGVYLFEGHVGFRQNWRGLG